MAPKDRAADYGARLLLDWLNERFDASLRLTDTTSDAFVAGDREHRVGVAIAPLWEREAAADWEQRLRSMEERLAGDAPARAFLLWAPPQADVPIDEPAASGFVERVQAAAASLEPGGRTEVGFPVNLRLAKTREEGGYASVVGGLNRWWTRITEKVTGTYYVDSTALHRLTHDGDAREQLWETIGRLSLSIEVGQVADFEVEEAWTLQRLPESDAEAGFAIIGAPPAVDATDGILVRRMARRRLQAANDALAPLDAELSVVGLVGSYEYADVEGASPTIKALNPSLYSRLQVVCVLVDGEVCPVFLPRSLPWSE